MTPTGARRRARAYALQIVFSLDDAEHDSVDEALAVFWRSFEPNEADRDAIDFASALVRGTWSEREQVDETIKEASRNWRLERMSRVDRNILRLAAHELRAMRETPIRIVINEAVELAKRFGGDESAAFVNGILDRVAQSIRG